MFGFDSIPIELLQADSKKRCKFVFVHKDKFSLARVYVPLYRRCEAEPITDKITYTPMPVAVYELDEYESKNRPFNIYFYKGDTGK